MRRPAANASPVWSRSQVRWRVGGRNGGRGLDLDPDHLPAGGLDKQVYFLAPLFFFLAPLFFAHVVQARVVAARGEFRAQLRGDEGVEEAAQHVWAVQDGVQSEPEHSRHRAEPLAVVISSGSPSSAPSAFCWVSGKSRGEGDQQSHVPSDPSPRDGRKIIRYVP
jgi:hypothetical protein